MQGWQSTFLGIRQLPRALSAFELQGFEEIAAVCRAHIDTQLIRMRGQRHSGGRTGAIWIRRAQRSGLLCRDATG